MLKSASVSVASLARSGQLGHLGEVCCYGTGRHGTDANKPTHARLRNLNWMTYSPCDDHGHNKGDEPSFPLNGKHGAKREKLMMMMMLYVVGVVLVCLASVVLVLCVVLVCVVLVCVVCAILVCCIGVSSLLFWCVLFVLH